MITRRHLLLKYGPAATLVAPLMSAFRPDAMAASEPRRLITFFSSSGVRQDIFWPKGSPGTAGSGRYSVEGTSLEPLAPHLADIVIPRGLLLDRGSGDSHDAGTVACTTGHYLKSRSVSSKPFASGPSIDTHLSSQLSKGLPERMLVLGVRLRVNRISKYTSFDANGYPIEPAQNPYTVYKRLFANLVGRCEGGSPDAEVARTRFLRKSVLDSVREQMRSFRSHEGLSGEESLKLDRMEGGIRDIENRLDAQVAAGTSSADCSEQRAGFDGGREAADTDANFPQLLKLHLDLIALAAELDLTRVITISLSGGGSGGAPMTWLKWKRPDGKLETIDASHHNVTHGQQRGVANDREKLAVIDRWNFEQFAYLIGKLKAVSDGARSALDNSIVWYGSCNGDGKPHSNTDPPLIVAGRAGGRLVTGRYLTFAPQRIPHQRLLTDFCNLLGVPTEAFGRKESVAGTAIA